MTRTDLMNAGHHFSDSLGQPAAPQQQLDVDAIKIRNRQKFNDTVRLFLSRSFFPESY
jgi:hypothetical protein